MKIQNVLLSDDDMREAVQDFLKQKGIDLEVKEVNATFVTGFTHKVSFELPEPEPIHLPTHAPNRHAPRS